METTKSSSKPSLNKLLLRTFSKVLRIKITPEDRIPKLKFKNKEEEGYKLRNEALLAKLFACVSSVKAAYAQLQIFQSPYDPDGVQSSDKVLVDELKKLCQVKLSYLMKQHLDEPPQVTFLSAELEEEKGLLKMYEISVRKLESMVRFKDSEVTFLREKLVEFECQNTMLEDRIEGIGFGLFPESVSLVELNIKHFVIMLRHAVGAIQGFAKLLVHNISTSSLDLVSAANEIEPNVVCRTMKDIVHVIESFVSGIVFDAFQFPKFSHLNQGKQEHQQSHFLDRFWELKSKNVDEYLALNSHSTFGTFCRVKYLSIVHPKLELAFFGDLKQRNIVDSGGYPKTAFFRAFAEMARRVWLLHCLAFSYEPEASIFQVRKGCRFSEVFMENVVVDDEREIVDPRVGFTVIPGFKIGRTVIQCQVYLC